MGKFSLLFFLPLVLFLWGSAAQTSPPVVYPPPPVLVLYNYYGCDAGVVYFQMIGLGLGSIRLYNNQAKSWETDLFSGRTSVPINDPNTLKLIQFFTPWQKFFTLYTAVVYANTTFGEKELGRLNFTCSEGLNPTTAPIALNGPTTAPDPVFGPLSTICKTTGDELFLYLTAYISIRDITLTPTTVSVNYANGTSFWTSTIYSFNPMVLSLRLPISFNLSATYQVQISYQPAMGMGPSVLLHTYNGEKFCPTINVPWDTKTLTPAAPTSPSSLFLFFSGCSLGVFTFTVKGPATSLKLLNSDSFLWEVDLLTGSSQKMVPMGAGPRLVRFAVPVTRMNSQFIAYLYSATGASTYLAVSCSKTNFVPLIPTTLSPTTAPAPTTPLPPGATAPPPTPRPTVTFPPAPIPSGFSFLGCLTGGVARFFVNGTSAQKLQLRRANGVLEINQASGLDYVPFLDISAVRNLQFVLPPNSASVVYDATIYSSPSYGSVVVGNLRFSCATGPL